MATMNTANMLMTKQKVKNVLQRFPVSGMGAAVGTTKLGLV